MQVSITINRIEGCKIKETLFLQLANKVMFEIPYQPYADKDRYPKENDLYWKKVFNNTKYRLEKDFILVRSNIQTFNNYLRENNIETKITNSSEIQNIISVPLFIDWHDLQYIIEEARETYELNELQTFFTHMKSLYYKPVDDKFLKNEIIKFHNKRKVILLDPWIEFK